MGVRINTNIEALNAQRNLATSAANFAKSVERLSSGLRINRAGDDAAGLTISEKLRGQIRGLNQAVRNAQDGISLIQTAEGALGETHSILQRMRELAVQSASDTSTDSDRTSIQSEVDQLAQELTRISNTTEFNTKNLLSGAFGGGGTTAQKFQIGANSDQNISLQINAMDAQSLGVAFGQQTLSAFAAGASGLTSVSNAGSGMNVTKNYTIDTNATAAAYGAVTASGTAATGTTGGTFTGSADTTYRVRIDGIDGANGVNAASYSKDGGNTWTTLAPGAIADAGANVTLTLDNGVTFNITDDATNSSGDYFDFAATAANTVIQLQDAAGVAIGAAVTVHNNQSSAIIGNTTTGETVQANFSFASLADSGAGVGTDASFSLTYVSSAAAVVAGNGQVTTAALTYGGIKVDSQANANLAITTINNSINTVSTERSKLGAVQNRIEHTIANLSVASENLSASESRIRDVDLAAEMVSFTKSQILQQAGTAILAQANQAPNSVLQLLR